MKKLLLVALAAAALVSPASALARCPDAAMPPGRALAPIFQAFVADTSVPSSIPGAPVYDPFGNYAGNIATRIDRPTAAQAAGAPSLPSFSGTQPVFCGYGEAATAGFVTLAGYFAGYVQARLSENPRRMPRRAVAA